MPIDLVVLDMAKDPRIQIILGRPFLTTAGCKIDVKEQKLTSYVGEHHVQFGLFKNLEPSSTFHAMGVRLLILMSLWMYLM